jgi:hypothetical protein
MTKDLYTDIQSTIQNAFVASVRFKNFNQDFACLLVLLGTDTLEAKFGCVRTLTHARNCDYLELIERLKISQQIEQINIEHPEWKRKNRLSTNTDTTDHSSINDWIGDLTTTNIIVDIIWNMERTLHYLFCAHSVTPMLNSILRIVNLLLI